MSFTEFYTRVHAREPFPWQVRLAQMVSDGEWPEALTLPTGCGKTSIVDVWAWATAQGFSGVPRRLFYVVDRRIIVDAVSNHAESLVAHVPGLVVARLRGGALSDETWVRDPGARAIIATTVDQLGSRLLFRAYGVSANVAPIHAALAGNDALIVLDEAHLSGPFLKTLSRVEHYRRDKLALPWRKLVMTATPPEGVSPFSLDEHDLRHPLIAKRIGAAKPARLVQAAAGSLAKEVVESALALREEGAAIVGVVVNRVADGREIFRLLRKSGDAVLLTGRVRPLDRDALLEEALPRIAAGAPREHRGELFVVATQTIEVGADLDFDALVTEAAPVPELRQRFGRLNRLGEHSSSPAVIVRRHVDGRKSDPVYGDDLAAAWKWLQTVTQGRGKNKHVDFGVGALDATCDSDPPPARSQTPSPTLLPAHLNVMAHTSPRPPLEIAPYLHGWQSSADVMVVWRADLIPDDEDNWADVAVAAPPAVGEMLPIPVYALRSWLKGDVPDVADIEGVESKDERNFNHVKVLVWDRESPVVVNASRVVAGNVVIVPAAYGGCDRYGWAPSSKKAVQDLGDQAVSGSRARIQLHPRLYPEHSDEIERLLADERPDPDPVLDAIGVADRLRSGTRTLPYPGGLLIETGSWRVEPLGVRRAIKLDAHLEGVAAWAGRFAESCGIAVDATEAVVNAAAAHDVGKAEPSFQILLGGKPGNVLAKSAIGSRVEMQRAREAAGLPRGWRHEIASVARADGLNPLERYLAGTHHGRGRPMLPAAPDIPMWQAAGGAAWPELASDLTDEWGLWGLAYLEAIVRLADWSRSEEEQRD